VIHEVEEGAKARDERVVRALALSRAEYRLARNDSSTEWKRLRAEGANERVSERERGEFGGARECEGARKRGRERADRENEHADLLNYIILHTIITLDIHYVYCIYVSIIVVSYIAMMMTIMSTIITDDFVEGRGKCDTHARSTRVSCWARARARAHELIRCGRCEVLVASRGPRLLPSFMQQVY